MPPGGLAAGSSSSSSGTAGGRTAAGALRASLARSGAGGGGGLSRTHSFSTDIGALHRADARKYARFGGVVPDTRGTAVGGASAAGGAGAAAAGAGATSASRLGSQQPAGGGDSGAATLGAGAGAGAGSETRRPVLAPPQPALRRHVSLVEVPSYAGGGGGGDGGAGGDRHSTGGGAATAANSGAARPSPVAPAPLGVAAEPADATSRGRRGGGVLLGVDGLPGGLEGGPGSEPEPSSIGAFTPGAGGVAAHAQLPAGLGGGGGGGGDGAGPQLSSEAAAKAAFQRAFMRFVCASLDQVVDDWRAHAAPAAAAVERSSEQ